MAGAERGCRLRLREEAAGSSEALPGSFVQDFPWQLPRRGLLDSAESWLPAGIAPRGSSTRAQGGWPLDLFWSQLGVGRQLGVNPQLRSTST